MRLEDKDSALRRRPEAFSPAAVRPGSGSCSGKLLIDLEEDKAGRAVVFGLFAEMGDSRAHMFEV